jgi:hypothetical protein
MQADLGRGQDQLGALQRALQAEQGERGATADRLRSTIDGLASQNAELRKNMEGLMAGLPAVSNALDHALMQIAQLRRPRPAAAPLAPEPPASLVLSIVPRGGSRAIDWRLPIPE